MEQIFYPFLFIGKHLFRSYTYNYKTPFFSNFSFVTWVMKYINLPLFSWTFEFDSFYFGVDHRDFSTGFSTLSLFFFLFFSINLCKFCFRDFHGIWTRLGYFLYLGSKYKI